MSEMCLYTLLFTNLISGVSSVLLFSQTILMMIQHACRVGACEGHLTVCKFYFSTRDSASSSLFTYVP